MEGTSSVHTVFVCMIKWNITTYNTDVHGLMLLVSSPVHKAVGQTEAEAKGLLKGR